MRHIFNNIISLENLLVAWREFLCGKKRRQDVLEFSLKFTDHLFSLHHELTTKTYQHGCYQSFKINDPKPREIHKASIRDRLLHHAIYRILYPYFDKLFIYDSYSCRNGKGTHRAISRFRKFGRKVSLNNTQTCWILKCDIKKFFASIDHQILKNILVRYVEDRDTLWLLAQIIDSFNIKEIVGVGLPLGNLTSQLLANIYLNELDQFVKRQLKIKYYIRYADDFVIFHEDKNYLQGLTSKISEFLETKLALLLHPEKVFIKTLSSGVDFLGWIHFSHHRVLRTTTKHRMFKHLNRNPMPELTASYLGLLSYGSTFNLRGKICPPSQPPP